MKKVAHSIPTIGYVEANKFWYSHRGMRVSTVLDLSNARLQGSKLFSGPKKGFTTCTQSLF